MKKKFIKRAIPAEISDKGGAYVQFVEKDTVPLDGVIVDAIDGSYCQGRPTLILAAIQGLLKSMARGVATDGHPRQVADYITVYLVVDGEIDLDRGFDPEVNSLKIRARLLNEMEIDITGWALEDVTPGRRSFTLASAYTGNAKGAWKIGESGEINGDNVPSTRTGETIRVDWAVEGTDKSGTIPADKVTSNISRIDIAADALAELASEEYDGKTVVFTVRGNFSSAKISATLKYVAPPPPPEPLIDDDHTGLKLMEVLPAEGDDERIIGHAFRLSGVNLGKLDSPTWRLTDVEGYSGPCETQIDADGNGGRMTMQVMAGDPPAGVHTAVFSATVTDTGYTKTYTFELEVKA